MRVPVLLIVALLAACGQPQPPLVASDVEITRAMPGRDMSAGFLVLSNNTGEAIRISGVSSPQYESVEIHETTTEDGVSRMRKLDELVVPARGSVTLERGGKHLMLMHARGNASAVTLQFMGDDAPLLSVVYSFTGDRG